ncbi:MULTISPECIES: hypothetical protein [Staphylococcus]|uniref:hypothetical protein n=1 Tax=Staphylococcus TaxID=1279 RepID=UPI00081A2E42|nr:MULTISPECIES: hypothetical protein [Staphylococcus]ANZ33874.1 hypothetical protein BEK99_08775 [Staphylococcus carnosus]ATH66504.1 hypothetical protein BJG89_14185 [Staphylococcus nepalensis]POA05237.1 hypothetical protein CD153_03035 [Staphylococcus carnosus]QRQ05757.1 hypothetical protein I6J34_03565 [Staphylococcus carnosus]UTB80993.1 hypothetical protein A2I65_08865 [Staphylococcus carnosus]
MNILKYITNIIINDPILASEVNNRIYYYEVTEVDDTSDAFVVLTPILDRPSTYVSDKYLSETYFFQVDVESYNHQQTIDITKRIRYLLSNENLNQASSQLDDYFKATQRYVMSRRYRGIPKYQYYKGERVE